MMNEQFGVAICDVLPSILPPSVEETKAFEEYLLIKSTIEQQIQNSLKENLLQNLEQAYKAGHDLMDVLRWIRK